MLEHRKRKHVCVCLRKRDTQTVAISHLSEATGDEVDRDIFGMEFLDEVVNARRQAQWMLLQAAGDVLLTWLYQLEPSRQRILERNLTAHRPDSNIEQQVSLVHA